MFRPIGLCRPTSRVHDEHPVVLIIGLTGIGRATALTLAKEGARIALSGRRNEAGQTLLAELRVKRVDAEFWRAEVGHDDDIRDLVDKAVARFDCLDVAVNNAGTEGKPGPVTEQFTGTYSATFDTNVLGTLLSMRHDLRARCVLKPGETATGSAGEMVETAEHRDRQDIVDCLAALEEWCVYVQR